jgi:hypothetical protein
VALVEDDFVVALSPLFVFAFVVAFVLELFVCPDLVVELVEPFAFVVALVFFVALSVEACVVGSVAAVVVSSSAAVVDW